MSDQKHTLIVGAGISGLTCGTRLTDLGHRVMIVDRGRGPGGRMATRTFGDARFNHGAQFFTARSQEFQARVREWVKTGLARRWSGRVVRIIRQQAEPYDDGREHYVGVGGMSTVCEALSKRLDCRSRTIVKRVEWSDPTWSVFDDRGRLIAKASNLVLAMPAPQAAALLGAADDVGRRVAEIEMDPTWALMIARAAPKQIPFDAAYIEHDAVAWMMRSVEGENSWVVHATHDWSRKNVTRDPQSVAYALLAHLSDAIGLDCSRPGGLHAHRWRYAIPTVANPLDAPVLLDPSRNLLLCGDWCGRGRVESAFQSGLAAAESLHRASTQAASLRPQ